MSCCSAPRMTAENQIPHDAIPEAHVKSPLLADQESCEQGRAETLKLLAIPGAHLRCGGLSSGSMHGMATSQGFRAVREALHSALAHSGCAAADHEIDVLDSPVKSLCAGASHSSCLQAVTLQWDLLKTSDGT